MKNAMCPKCGKKMELEEVISYYGDSYFEWVCYNPKYNYKEE